MQDRLRSVTGLTLMAIAISSFATLPAAADAYPGTYMADSPDHYYCFGSSVSFGNLPKYIDSMSYLDDATHLYDVRSSNCGSLTDVVFAEGPLDPYVRGQTTCARPINATLCEQFWVQVNPNQVFGDTYSRNGDGDNYDLNFVKTIRHELGHTIGLNNDGVGYTGAPLEWRDCMVSGWVPTDLLWTTYSSHHVGHVNPWY